MEELLEVVKAYNFGIIIDSIIDMREIVVRKLEGLVEGIEGLKEATILENGQVILIIDPISLLNKISCKKTSLQPNTYISESCNLILAK